MTYVDEAANNGKKTMLTLRLLEQLLDLWLGLLCVDNTAGDASLSPPGAPLPARWWRTVCPVLSCTG